MHRLETCAAGRTRKIQSPSQMIGLYVIPMAYTADILDSLVPITQFNRGQASKIFDRLHSESRLIVLKNNQPAAIILSPSEFQRLSEIEEDYILLLEATRRLKEDSSSTSSREDVMSELGISEADLAAAGDVVME